MILRYSDQVTGGMLIFFATKHWMNKACQVWSHGPVMKRLRKKKKVFIES